MTAEEVKASGQRRKMHALRHEYRFARVKKFADMFAVAALVEQS